MTTTAVTRGGSVARTAVLGAAGGVAGGVVFGVLMQAWGMIPMVASLVGSTAPAVGWVVHMAIATFIGAVYGVLVAPRMPGLPVAVAAGLAYGVLWWILGALVLMPAMLGMPLFGLNEMAWRSLLGHLVYGVILAVLVSALVRRAR